MSAGDIAKKVFEWLFRPAALREARAALGNERRETAIRQAKLLFEVGRRVSEPADELPRGAHPPVSLGLYRDAIYWALVAQQGGDGAPPPDLRALWDASEPQALAAAAPDREASAALRRTLVDDYDPRTLDVKEADAARARAFAEALLLQIEAPRRRVHFVLAQRWMGVAAVALVALVLVFSMRALVVGSDLAAGKPFRVSQWWPGWTACLENEDCKQLMFVTEKTQEPWVEIDLGAPKAIQQIDVVNRSKCCQDSAVPLIVEVSTDQKAWTQVARRDETFNEWTTKFRPRVARYVRLKALKLTFLHFKSIQVR